MSTYVVNRQEDCSIARKEASPVNEPHSHTRPRGVRKHKKGRSRQLRPIHHRRMKTTKKDECSYSVSNAIRTLAMVRGEGLEPS